MTEDWRAGLKAFNTALKNFMNDKPETVRTVNSETAETSTVVVCASLKERPDKPGPEALQGLCSKCGQAIWYHPLSPTTPPKICNDCNDPQPGDVLVTGEHSKDILKRWGN